MGKGNGIRLGKLLGIPIILDYSFFISVTLITVLLGSSIFPDRIHPEPSDATVWSLAVVAGLIFFISLLLHELAHSVMARFFGMPVASITLFLLGGVSRINKDSEHPHQEFLIAFVGPLTSALLGLAFIGAYFAVGADERPVAAMLLWLGIVNISLAIFNMIPGFPLDGGRVLRSILWAVLRSQSRATRVAARIGQGFGGLMAIFGLASFLNIEFGADLGPISGIWLLFIGAFLYNAATQSYRATKTDDQLSSVRVRDMMSTELRPVDADTRVHWLAPSRDDVDPRSAYLITDDGAVVGLVTGAVLLLLDEATYRSARLGDVMIRAGSLAPIAPSATGHEALQRLQLEKAAILPVVEDGQILGLIGIDQIAQFLRPRPARATG